MEEKQYQLQIQQLRELTNDFTKIQGTKKINTINGELECVKAVVRLQKDKGHLYELTKGVYGYTDEGYRRLNQLAGINFITPKTVVVNGVAQPNPYVKLDENGFTDSVFIRKIGVGRNANGQVSFLDQTLIFNPKNNFMRDLIAKSYGKKWNDKKGKYGGYDYTSGEFKGIIELLPKASAEAKMKENAYMLYYPCFGDMGILIDTSNSEVRKMLQGFLELRLFAVQRAETCCERNILKKMMGVKTVPKTATESGYVDIPMIVWRDSSSKEDIERLAEQVEGGVIPSQIKQYETSIQENDEPEADAEPEEQENDEPENEGATLETVQNMEKKTEEKKPVIEATEVKVNVSEVRERLIKLIKEGADNIGGLENVLTTLKITVPLEKCSMVDLEKINQQIQEILN